MGLIFLEALGAGVLLALIVWWTMFAGRVKGELPGRPDSTQPTPVAPVTKPPHAHQGEAE